MSFVQQTRAPIEADLAGYVALYARENPRDSTVNTIEYFRWKFLQNPHGPALVLHLHDGNDLVAMFATIPRLVRRGSSQWTAAYGVNFLVRDDRRGIATVNALLRGLQPPKDTNFILLTPNHLSAPIWQRFCKFEVPFELAVFAVPLRPARLFARSGRSWARYFQLFDPMVEFGIEVAGKVGASGHVEVGVWPDLEELAAFMRRVRADRIAGVSDAPFLKWRFQDAPFQYKPIIVRKHGNIVAFAALRTLRYDGYDASVLLDVSVDSAVTLAGRKILGAAISEARNSGADLLLFMGIASAPDISPALSLPFVKVPSAVLPQRAPVMFKFDHQLRAGENRPSTNQESWRITLADCDMF